MGWKASCKVRDGVRAITARQFRAEEATEASREEDEIRRQTRPFELRWSEIEKRKKK